MKLKCIFKSIIVPRLLVSVRTMRRCNILDSIVRRTASSSSYSSSSLSFLSLPSSLPILSLSYPRSSTSSSARRLNGNHDSIRRMTTSAAAPEATIAVSSDPSSSASSISSSSSHPSLTIDPAIEAKRRAQRDAKAESKRLAKLAAVAAASAPAAPVAAVFDALSDSSSSDIDPYMALRRIELREAGLSDAVTGEFAYPNTYKPTMDINDFLRTFSSLAPNDKSDIVDVCLVGRLHSKRSASSKLLFYDLVGSSCVDETESWAASTNADATKLDADASAPSSAPSSSSAPPITPTSSASRDLTLLTPFSPKVQIMSSLGAHLSTLAADSDAATIASATAAFKSLHHALRRGDIVWIKGQAQRTKQGELSIVPTEVKLLVPCWHEIPAKLIEPNLRYRQRYLDMLVNRSTLRTFHLRSSVISSIRSFLTARNFVEVETPILWTGHGGATAKPFVTSSVALGTTTVLPLYMRIAPELFLKELVIGGMDRVFEVSKVFRNEGMDATHNPEFTTVEMYQAYATYEDIMTFTEEIIRSVVIGTTKKSSILITTKDASATSITIDITQPFARIDVMDGLLEAIGEGATELPSPNDEASLPFYLSACQRHTLHVSSPPTLARCLDTLISHFLESRCISPTFLLHHPESLSPLARRHPTKLGCTERFELFINGSEYANAYSELNDPADQHKRMTAQAKAGMDGDDEAQPMDQHFCTALEYGLAPTAGWGLGIDRLVMLLSGQPHIRDVLLFPVMKPHLPAVAAAAVTGATIVTGTSVGAKTNKAVEKGISKRSFTTSSSSLASSPPSPIASSSIRHVAAASASARRAPSSAIGSAPSLKQFMLRQQVLHLYRSIVRMTRRMADVDQRRGVMQHAEAEFRSMKNANETPHIRQLIKEGERRRGEFETMMNLTK